MAEHEKNIDAENIIVADVWIDCPYNPNVRHKLQKGNYTPFYECECLGISLGSELKEGDEVIAEEICQRKI